MEEAQVGLKESKPRSANGASLHVALAVYVGMCMVRRPLEALRWNIYIYIYTYVCIYMCMCAYLYVYVYVFVYVCMCSVRLKA